MATEDGSLQVDAGIGDIHQDVFRTLLAWDVRYDSSGVTRICLYREPDGHYCCEYENRDSGRGIWRDVLSEDDARAFYATLRMQIVADHHAFS